LSPPLLLFHNSPRVKRYFAGIAEALPHRRVVVVRVGVGLSRSDPAPELIEEIIDYGVRRKEARPHYGPRRLGLCRRLYALAARLHLSHVRGTIRRVQPGAVGVWGGNAVDARAVVVGARMEGVPCFQFENGFLPDTTQMDLEGVNVEGSVPDVPEFYRMYRSSPDPEHPLPEALLPRDSRYLKTCSDRISLPDRFIFAPFQVALDSQVLLHSHWIRDMRAFFRVVVEAVETWGDPGLHVVFKEHPSCPWRYPELHREAAERSQVYFANGNSTEELIRRSRGTVTLNSTVGVEALLMDRPVLALGRAVYGISGVASTAESPRQVGRWVATVAADATPPSALREPFLRYLMEEHLIPGRHQAPGPEHYAAIEARLLALESDRGPERESVGTVPDSGGGSDRAPSS
jgi:capsular polysaccharide export protein